MTFQPSLELNAAFYQEIVEPMVRPVPHAAALLGWGSDVLGFDTARSTDHGWGPRLQIFVGDDAVEDVRPMIEAGLPAMFLGWPVRYSLGDDDPVVHRVDVTTLGDWLTDRLAVDPRLGLSSIDWLVIPQQALLGVVRGRIYADPAGDLAAVRETLAWYPCDVWLWLLACGWRRLDQEEPFVGRTAEVGDELGSRIIAARQVREIMRLAFLLERTYAPYSKWLGTAFARLPSAADLTPPGAGVGDGGGVRAAGRAAQPPGPDEPARLQHPVLLRPAVPHPRCRPVRRGLPRGHRRCLAA